MLSLISRCRIDFQIAEIAAGLYGNLWAFLSLLMEMLTPENGEICSQIADMGIATKTDGFILGYTVLLVQCW